MDQPTLAGFILFIRNQMGINTSDLPDAAPVIEMAYAVALEIVNLQLAQASPLIYTLAVYNLGGDNIINFAPNNPPSTFFTDTRANFNIASFAPGVVGAAADNSTSDSLLNPEFMKEFTMADLQYLKTPWGRQYLAFAQRVGTLWGVS